MIDQINLINNRYVCIYNEIYNLLKLRNLLKQGLPPTTTGIQKFYLNLT